MPFTIVREDITKMHVDAIVNAANTELQMGGGVCGSIFNAAGAGELQKAYDALAPIKTGEAVITGGFRLSAKYIIHAAGPAYRDGTYGEEASLRSAYTNALRLAAEYQCESIAFPLISSRIYGYPKKDALKVATTAIKDFLMTTEMSVYLAVFDKKSFEISTDLHGRVDSYIDEHYAAEHYDTGRELFSAEYRDVMTTAVAPPPKFRRNMPVFGVSISSTAAPEHSLSSLIEKLDEPFSATLFRLIDETGKSDVEIYSRANIDRRLFSKIRNEKGYHPKKTTVIAFAVALELTLEQTKDLLERAGYALSHSSKFDLIVEYFITNKIYDIFEINEMLFEYDQLLLGGAVK